MIYNKLLGTGKKIIFLSLSLYILFFVSSLGSSKESFIERPIKVVWVIDGDTFVLKNKKVIRLKGIDTPEISHEPNVKSQYFAKKAKRYLIKLIGRKYVIIKRKGLTYDRYKRLVAYVYLPDGTFLNEFLIKKGYAFYFPHKDIEPYIAAILLLAQREAMIQRRGFWKKILTLDIANQLYIGNLHDKRFHVPTCNSVKKIYWKNKVYFHSLFEAFYNGYAPCRKCTPWPRE